MEQKIKQDINIGANIRAIRKQKNIKQVDLVRLLQLEGVEITRETLVKIESGVHLFRHLFHGFQGLTDEPKPYPRKKK